MSSLTWHRLQISCFQESKIIYFFRISKVWQYIDVPTLTPVLNLLLFFSQSFRIDFGTSIFKFEAFTAIYVSTAISKLRHFKSTLIRKFSPLKVSIVISFFFWRVVNFAKVFFNIEISALIGRLFKPRNIYVSIKALPAVAFMLKFPFFKSHQSSDDISKFHFAVLTPGLKLLLFKFKLKNWIIV